jgi:hypothetical protein
MGILIDHGMHHRQSMFDRADDRTLLVGRVRCEHPQELIQMSLINRFGCQDQMAQVRRIESSAKDAYPHSLILPLQFILADVYRFPFGDACIA